MASELAFARLASNLLCDMECLGHSGRAHRVSFRLQAAAGIDGPGPAQCRTALLRIRTTFAFVHKPEILNGHDLGDGEAIVNLGN